MPATQRGPLAAAPAARAAPSARSYRRPWLTHTRPTLDKHTAFVHYSALGTRVCGASRWCKGDAKGAEQSSDEEVEGEPPRAAWQYCCCSTRGLVRFTLKKKRWREQILARTIGNAVVSRERGSSKNASFATLTQPGSRAAAQIGDEQHALARSKSSYRAPAALTPAHRRLPPASVLLQGAAGIWGCMTLVGGDIHFHEAPGAAASAAAHDLSGRVPAGHPAGHVCRSHAPLLAAHSRRLRGWQQRLGFRVPSQACRHCTSQGFQGGTRAPA